MAERLPLIQILRTPPTGPAPVEKPATDISQWPAVAERLRTFAEARGQRNVLNGSAERCEFCGAGMDEQHGHVIDLSHRALMCVCRPCYLLFTHDGAGGARFRAVPERYDLLSADGATIAALDTLQVPTGLAFFFTNSLTGRTTAFYPSPAGATESELPLAEWADVVHAVPLLARMAADVEALLVRRIQPQPGGASADARTDALIVPIDVCYELVGRIRRVWRGFQGGDDVWREIDDCFARAIERAKAAT